MSYQQYIEPCTDTPQQVDKPRLEVATSTEKVLKQIFSGKSVPNKIVGEYKVTPIMSYINRELDILSLRENEILAETWNDYLTAAPTPAPRFRLYRELSSHSLASSLCLGSPATITCTGLVRFLLFVVSLV
ncbi:uncharacterized protein LOC119661838 isoform X2 [Teleopsis dalmanni]|uniref:uncharacterized protein LOC119661838 isoform X2 n=1 Tax=Teleopsis dalmanni TaxID=139649 RepID=UPI0018CE163B|nr:uncharacterized protein LOC119661838 isoform X2 [Teleopsis dalmanni]